MNMATHIKHLTGNRKHMFDAQLVSLNGPTHTNTNTSVATPPAPGLDHWAPWTVPKPAGPGKCSEEQADAIQEQCDRVAEIVGMSGCKHRPAENPTKS